ncbi:hypothetical protein PYCC9005_004795 [Savitreella phatthalungensis]
MFNATLAALSDGIAQAIDSHSRRIGGRRKDVVDDGDEDGGDDEELDAHRCAVFAFWSLISTMVIVVPWVGILHRTGYSPLICAVLDQTVMAPVLVASQLLYTAVVDIVLPPTSSGKTSRAATPRNGKQSPLGVEDADDTGLGGAVGSRPDLRSRRSGRGILSRTSSVENGLGKGINEVRPLAVNVPAHAPAPVEGKPRDTIGGGGGRRKVLSAHSIPPTPRTLSGTMTPAAVPRSPSKGAAGRGDDLMGTAIVPAEMLVKRLSEQLQEGAGPTSTLTTIMSRFRQLLRERWYRNWRDGCVVWGTVGLISFTYVPVHRRPAFGALIGVFWNIYFCLVNSESPGTTGGPLAQEIQSPLKALPKRA